MASADNAVIADDSSDKLQQGSLRSASFVGLLLTQLLTATNDNVFRWLVIGIGKDYYPDNVSAVLTAGSACFLLPYLLLAAPAGYLADRFSKRTVIVACKVAEVIIMVLGIGAILLGSPIVLFVVVALMGAQSALFSPSKLGSIPEMLKSEKISAANGAIGLTTVISTVVGTVVGLVLSDVTGDKGQTGWWISASVLIGIAVIGWLFSLLIARLPAADPTRRFPWDAPQQTFRDLRVLASDRPLLRVALGLMFFWSLGLLANLNIDQFAMEGGALRESDKAPLMIGLVFGIGFGSVLAGIWSGGRVELGIVPLGAAGIALSSLLLFTVQGTIISPTETVTVGFILACLFLTGLGFSAGLFDVPLSSYMQHRSPPEQRGAILAASNFLTFSGMLVMSFLYLGMRVPLESGKPLLSAPQIFLIGGIMTLPVFVYIVCLLPQATIRFLVWLLSRTIYRVRIVGRENLPETGGALLVPNHVSWIDAVMLLLTTSRPIRIIAYAGNFDSRLLQWWAKMWGAILLGDNPKAIIRALKTATEALSNGELVCIFPEGAITRTGQLQAFKPGMMKILKGTSAPVVPVYLDGLWGSVFSFDRGKFFWKWPRRWPYRISIHFGQAISDPNDVHYIRRVVQDLGANAVRERSEKTVALVETFIRRCKKRCCKVKVADSMGGQLSGGQLLIRTLVLRRLLRRHVLQQDEQHVGLLLPPSLGGVVANMALSCDRRTTVNLNYTVSSEVLNACIAHAGIKHVLTSRKFMEKMNFDLNTEIVYLEDFKDKPTAGDKLLSAIAAYLVPAKLLAKLLGAHKSQGNDVLTVIFTSGSTGTPKGVMLTHANIASQVDAIEQVASLTHRDVFIGTLPFFHSLGFTVTLWAAMTLDLKAAYHFSPLDAKQVGKLCKQHGGTLLLSTPTFLRGYLRRCEPDELKSLEVIVTGAEKLPKDVADKFEQRFGVRPVEGYGTTELSPLVSVNVPPSRSTGIVTDCKEGTVGQPVPGVSAKIVDLDSGEELGANTPGMLMITGPNVMKGYLGREDLTADVIKDGWYVTGDVAVIDDDGFIKITGRESRFSKIGGEMVPHIKIEEELNELLNADEQLLAAVTAVPDAKKGERLIVIHTTLNLSVDELRKGLSERGLPNIFIPGGDSFLEVESLPVLGTGKLDLKAVKQLAIEKFAAGDAEA
ncbi:MAG: MFS transporter [Planctomycetaceae bacterium]|nr:MFS transporter [Planctomycetales bacterium]MCB9925149.1 MFS transporter [Planctomycetaceae bacterium]